MERETAGKSSSVSLRHHQLLHQARPTQPAASRSQLRARMARHSNWARAKHRPGFEAWPARTQDSFTGTAIVGAIGTGKTNRCMCPFAEQILTYRATDKDKRIGGQVLEVIGGVEEIPGFTSKTLEIAVKKHWGPLGAGVSEKNPILDSRLPDGSRVAAVVPCSFRGVVLTIRKFAKHFGIEDLVRIRTL